MKWLPEEDICAILTIEGHFCGIWANKQEKYFKDADVVDEWMGHVMKYEENREGTWLWRIKEGGKEITGECLGFVDE